jgi:hypothetical protein
MEPIYLPFSPTDNSLYLSILIISKSLCVTALGSQDVTEVEQSARHDCGSRPPGLRVQL